MKKRGFETLSDYEALMVFGGANADEHPWDEEAPINPTEGHPWDEDDEHPWDAD